MTAAMLAEIERLRFERLPAVERNRIRRRELVIPMYALGMVTHEIADAIGVKPGTVGMWSVRDPEINWWCRASYAARREVRAWTTEKQRDSQVTARELRKLRTAQHGGVAPIERHGSPSTYSNWCCRCEPCRAAWSVEMAARHRARRREARA
jgi:hypothetical protein